MKLKKALYKKLNKLSGNRMNQGKIYKFISLIVDNGLEKPERYSMLNSQLYEVAPSLSPSYSVEPISFNLLDNDKVKCNSCGSIIKPDKWDDVSENQAKAEIERPTATKENIKFCINPSGSVGVKVPDVGDFDFGNKDFSIVWKVNRPDNPKTTQENVCTCSNRKSITIRCNSCGGMVPVNNTINIKAERELPKKEVETFVYVVGKDDTPLRLVTFNKALTIGEVNELIKQASGERAFTLGGDPDKPFCDLL